MFIILNNSNNNERQFRNIAFVDSLRFVKRETNLKNNKNWDFKTCDRSFAARSDNWEFIFEIGH